MSQVSHLTPASKALHCRCLPVPLLVESFRDEARFIKLCQQCPQYGRNWSCPPYQNDASELLNAYQYAHIIGLQIMIAEQARALPKQAEERQAIIQSLLEPERRRFDEHLRAFEQQHAGTLAFYAGSCHLCKECTRAQGVPCRHPELQRYSLESVGFDVTACCENLLGIPLQWCQEDSMPPYFMLTAALLTQESYPKEWFVGALEPLVED